MLWSVVSVQILGLAVLVYGLLRAIARRRIYAALLAGLVFYHILMLLGINLSKEMYGLDVVSKGTFLVFMGACVLISTIETLEKSTFSIRTISNESYIDDVMRDPFPYVLVSMLTMAVIILIASQSGQTLLETNWVAARSERGFVDSIATLLQFVAFPAVWLIFKLRQRLAASIMLLVCIALFSVYGSRASLLTIPAIIALDLFGRGFVISRKAALTGGAIILLTVATLHVGGRILRGLGLGGLLALAQGDFSPILDSISQPGNVELSGGEGSISSYFFFVVSEGTIVGVEPFTTVFRWLTIYLPRWFAPEFKPMDATYLLWLQAANAGLFDSQAFTNQLLELLQQQELGSVHAMFWGEAWMNGGVVAVFVMTILLGIVVWAVDQLYKVVPMTVVALIAPATAVGYLMVARGNSVIGLGYTAYLLPPVLVGYAIAVLLRNELRALRLYSRHDRPRHE